MAFGGADVPDGITVDVTFADVPTKVFTVGDAGEFAELFGR